MSLSLQGSVAVQVTIRYTNPLDLSTPVDNLSRKNQVDYSSGTGQNQADRLWHDTRVVSGTNNDDINMLALTDSLGQTIAPARLRSMTIKASDTNSNNLLVVCSVTNGWLGPFGAAMSSGFALQPGQIFNWTLGNSLGWAVTSGAGTLRVKQTAVASNSPASYDIILVGASV